jgi:hypothetical protein
MKFLPFDHFTIKTSLTKNEAMKRIESLFKKRPSSSILKGTVYYGGETLTHTFNIYKIVKHFNRLVYPRLVGSITQDKEGSTIKVKVRFSIMFNIFLSIWFGSISLFVLFNIFIALKSLSISDIRKEPLFSLVGFYIAVIAGFNYCCIEYRKEMKELLQAQVIED